MVRHFTKIGLLTVMAFLMFCSSAWALTPKDIYQKVGQGVVLIMVADESGSGKVGTGSVISRDGLVITNAHVIMDRKSGVMGNNIQIYFKPPRLTGNFSQDLGRAYRAQILAHDADLDLGLLKIVDPPQPLTVVGLGDSDQIGIGEQVYAIGHPEQGGLWSMTAGIISARRQAAYDIPGKDLFQTDAGINRGNSGGPLLGDSGLMVGINSSIARKASDGLAITGINYAIQSDAAMRWMKSKGYSVPIAAGLTIAEVTPQPTAPTLPAPPSTAAPYIPKPTSPLTTAPPQVIEPTPPQVIEPTPPVVEKPTIETKPAAPLVKKNPVLTDDEKFLTQKRPYDADDLIKSMKEMEDMMDEMRDVIKSKFKD
ncbi:MAG: trypsin-like peptidase domain-containing protein [Pseudomonadota bacterium]